MNKEYLFMEKIDCKFPYGNRDLLRSLIFEAKAISVNALFYICYELCNLPKGTNISKEGLLSLFYLFKENSDLIGYDFIFDLIEIYLSGKKITEKQILDIMKILENKGEENYSILNILYSFNIESDSQKVEEKYGEIFNRWNN